MDIGAWTKSHKVAVYGGLAGVGLIGVVLAVKGRRSGAGATQTDYLTPDVLGAVPSGGVLTIGGGLGAGTYPFGGWLTGMGDLPDSGGAGAVSTVQGTQATPPSQPLSAQQLNLLNTAGAPPINLQTQARVATDLAAHPNGGNYWIDYSEPARAAATAVLAAPPGYVPTVSTRPDGGLTITY